MRILALKWRRLGDTVLWSSALQALRDHFPKAEIELALPAPYAALYAADPRFQTRHLLKSDERKVPPRGYDLALVFHASLSARRWAKATRPARCVVHHHDRRGLRFGSDIPVVNLGEPMAATERDLNVVRTLGWDGQTPHTRLFLAPEIAGRAREIVGSTAFTVFSPGASRPAKRWAKERWVELARRTTDDVVFLVESPSDFPEPFRSQLPSHARVVVTPRLEQALGVLALARRFVGSDSGLKHVAVALGCPTTTLFGPESLGEWHPYSAPHRALQKPVECRDRDRGDERFAWCGAEICPLASHACLSQITAEEVALHLEG